MKARDIINKRREQLGWTAYQLVEAMWAKGVSRGTVFKWLKGTQADARAETFIIACEVLGLKIVVDPKAKPVPGVQVVKARVKKSAKAD